MWVMTTPPQSGTVLYADQEHGGIRLVVLITLFITYILGFLLVFWLIRSFAPPTIADFAVFISCVGAVPLAVLAIWITERSLKGVWHSGLSLTVNQTGVFVEDTRDGGQALTPEAPPVINWSLPFAQLNWYFRLSGYPRGGRERRVPDKWFCICTELQQDENRLNVFSFMPPDQAADWIEDSPTGKSSFQMINPNEIYDSSFRSRIGPPSRPTIPTSLLHSKEGRYWLAERRRWLTGIELIPEDFAFVMGESQSATRTMTPGGENPSTP